MTEYYVSSLNMAAYLLYSGFELSRVELSPKKKRLYFFENSEELQIHLEHFRTDEFWQGFKSACDTLWKTPVKNSEVAV